MFHGKSESGKLVTWYTRASAIYKANKSNTKNPIQILNGAKESDHFVPVETDTLVAVVCDALMKSDQLPFH